MNDPGLYMHVYAQLRDCADLVDRVIIDLETAAGGPASHERKALASVLRALHTAPATNLSAMLLSNILRFNAAAQSANWSDIADAVDHGDASQPVITRLEELARVLECERADLHARMRGSHAR